MLPLLKIYADESCKDQHRYLAMGAVVLGAEFEAEAIDRLAAVRRAHNTFGEVKWTKTSKAKLRFYFDFVDVFFDGCEAGDMHFSGLYVDTHTFNHARWNGGSSEIGFNKLVYQLLLHKFGRRYGRHQRLQVFLDDRSTRADPDELRPMLNADLRKRWGVDAEPFRKVQFLDSKKSDILQVNDLLLGSIGFFKNHHHKRDGCSTSKIALGRHIVRRIRGCEPRPNAETATRFAVWKFRYRSGVGLAA